MRKSCSASVDATAGRFLPLVVVGHLLDNVPEAHAVPLGVLPPIPALANSMPPLVFVQGAQGLVALPGVPIALGRCDLQLAVAPGHI